MINNLNPNPRGILKSAKIHQHAGKKLPQLLDFDGIGTVANAKHPWLGCIHSPEFNKSTGLYTVMKY